ncbi:MAG: hypothetical protein K9J85_07425 [Desulfobacteraceae bacterium]|nr:hypothetical protein [Desulfobacteraceae bacterium]
MKELIAAAHGEQPADLLISDVRIVNVFSGEITEGNIAVKDRLILI